MILAKKEYIKPITEVIMIDTNCQMLSGSGTQTDTNDIRTGGDDPHDGDDGDIDLDVAKVNYWA
jgi:hypothetical protein